MTPSLSTKVLDHLGLVSGMFDELGLSQQIDSLLEQDLEQRHVSIGTACKALVLNGLGFHQRRLYMVSRFFEGKPTEHLLGEGIQPEHLNDTVLGRALDELHAYGCTQLFAQLAPLICTNLGLAPRYAHMDSTCFHLDGRYNDQVPPEEDAHVLHLTKGYSRDHRPDLNQVVLNLITDNQAGIPLHMEALNGNSSDKTSFRQTIAEHIDQLQNVSGFEYLTMDSAGYTAETIGKYSGRVKWISRVPETVAGCREAVSKSLTFKELAPGYQYATQEADYAGVRQRWLVVRSEEARKREVKTLVKNYAKQGQQEYRQVLKLEKQTFSCRQDAEKAAHALVSGLKTLQLEALTTTEKAVYKSKGRPGKDQRPEGVEYSVVVQVSASISAYNELKSKKGCFVLATNEVDEDRLPDSEVLTAYKGLSKVERGFRFMKDPQFMASSFFVKKPERVEALVFIMTLCLTVYAALEYRLRQELKLKGEYLPNQVGKKVQNPTARWIFECFTGIHLLYGLEKPTLLNINELHLQVIQLFGDKYKKYYFLE